MLLHDFAAITWSTDSSTGECTLVKMVLDMLVAFSAYAPST